jgi:hypothetical protein
MGGSEVMRDNKDSTMLTFQHLFAAKKPFCEIGI